MAIRTMRVAFFDWFTRFRTFFRVYASIGVAMVVIISVGMTLLLFLSLSYTFAVRPPPTGIYAPQNILLIPGLNEYVPSTLAVWLAFVLAIAIPARMGSLPLNIRVRPWGHCLVLPIGSSSSRRGEINRARG
jgi:hypothetical protein